MKTNLHRFSLLIAIMACSKSHVSGTPAERAVGNTTETSARPQDRRLGSSDAASDTTPEPRAPTAVTECTESPVGRSRCMIAKVLRDVSETYLLPGGGGISAVRAVARDTYAVSIAQEERVDVITYTLALDDRGEAVIKRRTESSETRGR